jgi:recombinational DNA repair protein RecT
VLFRSSVIGEAMVCTLDRAGIEKALGEAWLPAFSAVRLQRGGRKCLAVTTRRRQLGDGATLH